MKSGECSLMSLSNSFDFSNVRKPLMFHVTNDIVDLGCNNGYSIIFVFVSSNLKSSSNDCLVDECEGLFSFLFFSFDFDLDFLREELFLFFVFFLVGLISSDNSSSSLSSSFCYVCSGRVSFCKTLYCRSFCSLCV